MHGVNKNVKVAKPKDITVLQSIEFVLRTPTFKMKQKIRLKNENLHVLHKYGSSRN